MFKKRTNKLTFRISLTALFVLWLVLHGAKLIANIQVNIGVKIVSTLQGSVGYYTGDFVLVGDTWFTKKSQPRFTLSVTGGDSKYLMEGDISPSLSGTQSGSYDLILPGTLTPGEGEKTVDTSLVKLYSGVEAETVWLDSLDFELDQTIPSKPNLLSPNNSSDQYGGVNFSWSAAIDTGVGLKYYTYSIATDPSMHNLVFANTTSSTSFNTNVNALGAGTYYWMVMAEDHLGNYVLSDIWSFVVKEESVIVVETPPATERGGPVAWYTMFDYCPNGDFSQSYYDGLCTASDWVNRHESAAQEEYNANQLLMDTLGYSDEMYLAYKYAYDNGMTSIWPIDDAELYRPLVRKEYAKMVSQFAVHILKLLPEVNTGCVFSDVAEESDEFQYFMQLSCELGLMGLEYDGIPAKEFWPNLPVSRAMFGTVLSRLLFGSVYNGNSASWYEDHLLALKRADIMRMIDYPLTSELRGYAMLMLKRADEYGYADADAWWVSQYRRH